MQLVGSDKEIFTRTCAAIWGPEYQRKAAAHLGVSRRTVIYWASKEGHDPKDWNSVFVSLLAAVNDALMDTLIRKNRLIEFKKAYSSRGR